MTARPAFKLVFAGLLLAVLLNALDQTIVATALPTIVGELNGFDQLAWVITAYILASTIGLPIYGKLGDQFGRKPVFVFAVVLFLAGSVLSGLATSMPMLIAFRALQGLGGGGLMIGAQGIIADMVPPRDRGKYMGLLGAAFAVASISGPLLGGVITEFWGWRWIFYINVPLGAIALAFILKHLHLPRQEKRSGSLDYAGMALLSSASVVLVLVTSWGGTHDWTSPLILGLGALLLALVAAFILVERRAVSPLMPGHLFRHRQVLLATMVGILVGVVMFSTISYLPTFFQLVNGATAVGSGLMMIPMTLGNVIGSMGSGSIVSKTGRYKLFLLGGPVLMLGGLALLGTMGANTPYASAAAGMFLVGLGIGVMMQNLVVIVQSQVERSDLGVATSTTNYFRMIGASVGIAVFGSIFISSFSSKLAGADLGFTAGGEGGLGSLTPEFVHSLPAGTQEMIADALAGSMPQIFLISMGLAAGALVLGFLIRETPLSTSRS
ncbi:MDR family MFS transporter [Paeniglutamicibacter kerguelensis]|uniref:EmrB/QacA subfamily drug resistance transporter n=2 Tax=Paeniglutamicibacter kerguelensis TaxID=254788 RepID=A0ABS4XGI2_9MICC|nr:MDR family MFS transporter [Paeniglutamicibacter kerguelensis]MBP2387557.1 EmrB/QacA subfamily drug resistance transporter [Paeniglutamicibacter kerguelensis]